MAGKTHGTRTPSRMNEALGQNSQGFVARQTAATQDLREAIYLHPEGKQGHWVRNPHSLEPYFVKDLTGGSTFEPNSVVLLASFSGRRGEWIFGSSPAGMAPAAISAIQAPASFSPPSAAPVAAILDGIYSGWSFFCDGGGYVWTACYHQRRRFTEALDFLDGTYAVRVARLSMAELSGGAAMPTDGYEIDEFTDGIGGAELFRLDEEPLSSGDEIHYTVSIIQAGGLVFVVTLPDGGTTYTVHLMTDSGIETATDTFVGRAHAGAVEALLQHCAAYSNWDGSFFFAHPIGSGSQEFTFCHRSSSTGEVISSVAIDFDDDGASFAGMTAIPGESGLRIFRSEGGVSQSYRDFSNSMSPITAWVPIGFGPDNFFLGGAANSVCKAASGFAVLGQNVADIGVFKIEDSGAFDEEVGDNADARPPIYPASSNSVVFVGPTPGFADFSIYRMLSDGTMF